MMIEEVAHRVLTERVHCEGDCIVSERTPSHRYAQVRVGMERDFAHRVVWIAKHGPITDDLTIDHICRNTKCVNVEHLRLMTRELNGYLGHPRQETCHRGHPMDEAYVNPNTGVRACRACTSERNRRRYLARKSATVIPASA